MEEIKYNISKTLEKGLKGFVAVILAQIIPQIPHLIEHVKIGDWGEMTVRSAIAAALVMLANVVKHWLAPKKGNSIVFNNIKRII